MKWVTLLAYGQSLYRFTPEVNGELWTMNDVETFIEKAGCPEIIGLVTTRFDMHNWGRMSDRRKNLHLDWMKRTEGRVITQWGNDGTSAYPLGDVEEFFGIKKVTDKWGQPFWWASMCYMLALAIYEGFRHIHILGCDIVSEGYREERESINYLLGFAEARGVEVTGKTMASGAKILRYGYDDIVHLKGSDCTTIRFEMGKNETVKEPRS